MQRSRRRHRTYLPRENSHFIATNARKSRFSRTILNTRANYSHSRHSAVKVDEALSVGHAWHKLTTGPWHCRRRNDRREFYRTRSWRCEYGQAGERCRARTDREIIEGNGKKFKVPIEKCKKHRVLS